MVSQKMLVQLTAGRELFAAEEAGELNLLDLPLLHIGVVELDVIGHLTHVLTNEHAVLTQLTSHSPEQINRSCWASYYLKGVRYETTLTYGRSYQIFHSSVKRSRLSQNC